MRKHANAAWSLPDDVVSYDQAALAVLMDIREELRMIGGLMKCPNVQRGFVAMQSTARLLEVRLPPRKKRKLRSA